MRSIARIRVCLVTNVARLFLLQTVVLVKVHRAHMRFYAVTMLNGTQLQWKRIIYRAQQSEHGQYVQTTMTCDFVYTVSLLRFGSTRAITFRNFRKVPHARITTGIRWHQEDTFLITLTRYGSNVENILSTLPCVYDKGKLIKEILIYCKTRKHHYYIAFFEDFTLHFSSATCSLFHLRLLFILNVRPPWDHRVCAPIP